MRTPQLSLGPRLSEFEKAFADYIGVPHAVALSSGTAGLYLGLQALGIKEGDEVILPSFAFIAAANAVLHERAVPVFADIDPGTLNIGAASIERVLTARTRAILLVHTFGCPADLRPILDLACQHKLLLMEDACEAVGAEYQELKAGSFGDVSVFSFYPNKPMTTGEGGLLVTRHAAVARTVRALRNQGRMDDDGWLEHSLLGYNYRLSEMNCALGLSQLARLEDTLKRREAVARCYCEILRDYPSITPPPMTIEYGRVCWFAYVVKLPSGFTAERRQQVMETLAAAGIGSRPYFPPIHLQPLYAEYGAAAGSLPVTEDVASRTLALPFFNALKEDQIREVCWVLAEAVA